MITDFIIGAVESNASVLAPNGSPSALTLTVNDDTKITLNWTIGSTNHDGHRIYISTDGVTFTENSTVFGAIATKQVTGLTARTLYYFYVVAYKASIESSASNTVNAYTNPTWFVEGQPNNVLMVGDSFMRGAAASNELTLSFQALTTTALKARLGDAGAGCFWARKTDATYSYNWLEWSGDFSGSSSVGPGMLGSAASGLSNGKYWQITKYGKYFDLSYTTFSYRQTFQIYLDDVLYATIDQARYANPPGMYFTHRITAAEYGEHTIKVLVHSIYYCQLLQLICYSGNNGVNQILCGVAGFTTLAYVPVAVPDSFTYQCAIIQPKLTIIELGYNDYTGQVALDDYEARLTVMVNAALPYGDVYIINNTDYDPGRAIPISDYNIRIADVCTATGAHLIDMATVFGTAANALSNGWIVSATNWHPTDAGHQKFYEEIFKAVMS